VHLKKTFPCKWIPEKPNNPMNKIVILIQCADRVGLVAAISEIVAAHKLNITVMREFVDQDLQMFFTRIECTGTEINPPMLKKAFETKLGTNSIIQIHPEKRFKKIANIIAWPTSLLSIFLDN